MAERGGPRPNSGRKAKAVELKTAAVCKSALNSLYGGDEEAIIAVWNMGEPSLIKFILEHAFGKPTDNLNLSGGLTNTTEYDLSKLSSQALKELLNAATTDKPSEGGNM